MKERLKFDIAIPITKPSLEHDIRKLSELNVDALQPIYEHMELAEVFRIRLRMEFAATQTEVHQADIAAQELPPTQDPASYPRQRRSNMRASMGTFKSA